MHDQWMIGRTPFGGKNFCQCGWVARIGTQAVYRFRGEGDEFTGAKQLRCACDVIANTYVH
jgi:hypothetical protein